MEGAYPKASELSGHSHTRSLGIELKVVAPPSPSPQETHHGQSYVLRNARAPPRHRCSMLPVAEMVGS